MSGQQKRVYKPRPAKSKHSSDCGRGDDDPGCALPVKSVSPTIVINPAVARFVVHSTRGKYDVYVGRPNPLIPLTPEECIWGNPFIMKEESDRLRAWEQYRIWIQRPEQAQLFQRAKSELKGLVLGCWCSPRLCHAHILAAIANDVSLDTIIPGNK